MPKENSPVELEELKSDVHERRLAHAGTVEHIFDSTVQDDWENLEKLLRKGGFDSKEMEILKKIVSDLDKASQTTDSKLERQVRLMVKNRLYIKKLIERGGISWSTIEKLKKLMLELDDAITEDDSQREAEVKERVKDILSAKKND